MNQSGLRADPVTDTKAVNSVIEKFREKYRARGREEVLLEFDVAVLIGLGSTGMPPKR
jgi:predicted DNA-binding protein (UPF0278 family)